MVSDLAHIKEFLGQLGSNTVTPKPGALLPPAQVWIAEGGVAADGMRYAPPVRATAWGNIDCPLLPREVREHNRGVRIPDGLEWAFGGPLTVDQLDSAVLAKLLNEGDAWQLPPRAFREFIYNLPIPEGQTAIPAGVPLEWLEELPISGRTRGAVRKAFQMAGSEGFLKAPMLARQFLGIYSVGLAVLNELTCVIESAEVGPTGDLPTMRPSNTASQGEAAGHEALIDEAAIQIIKGMSSFNERLYEFAQWARAETDAQTFGEAIVELVRAGESNKVWNPLASIGLSNLTVMPLHPYELLDKWMEQIDLRSRAIFMGRISGHLENSLTLEELGVGFGVTRERMRQVEVRVRRSLGRFLESDEATPIQWRAATLRQMLSVAAPVSTVDHLLVAPTGCNDHRGILLELAGPYDHENDWLTLRSAQQYDPTSLILTQVDETGRINREFATSLLSDWGLDVSLHERWLTRDGSVRLFNGQLVLWGTSISDRLAFALSDIGRPATVDEMVSHVGENRSRFSINNALAIDSRIVRVSKTHWGLASWGEIEYSGVAESMRSLLEDFGQPMSVDEMTHRMHRTFGVAESTTLAYCNAPMFVVEGKLLRLRTQDDEPYRLDLGSIRRTPGIFWLGPMQLGRLFRVDWNMLRGSGTSLTHAAGAVLEIEVAANLSFTNGHGDHVQITFPETSLVGPSIGSVRRIAERLSAKEGDYLTLVLDRSDMTVTSSVTDTGNLSPGWQAISRLTGIAAPADLDGLAKAIHCHANEVRSVLRARRDDEILGFLPNSNPSTSLEEALSALEDQVESVRGYSL